MGALSRFVASMATLTRLAAGSPRNLRAYPDPIVYPGYAGRCPSGSLGLLPFGPGSHCALKGYGAAIRLHSDAGRVKLGAAPKGLLDLLLDLGRWDPLLDLDQVGEALDASQTTYRPFCPLPLIIPFDPAFQRDSPVPDDHPDVIRRIRQLVLDRGDGVARDFGIGPLVEDR